MRNPYFGVVQITPGKPLGNPGRGLAVVATQAGNVAAKFLDGSVLVFPVPVGLTKIDDVQVIDIVAASTTAVATYSALL